MKLLFNISLINLESLKLYLFFSDKGNNEIYTRYELVINSSTNLTVRQNNLFEGPVNLERIYYFENDPQKNKFLNIVKECNEAIIQGILYDLWVELTKNYNNIIKETGTEQPLTLKDLDSSLSISIRKNIMKMFTEDLYDKNDLNAAKVNMGWEGDK